MKAQIFSPTSTEQASIKACGLHVRLVVCGLLFCYVCFYPPLVSTLFIERSTRLAVEILILLIFVFYALLKRNFKVPKDLVWLSVLVLFYWIFSLDKTMQVLSFFNKFVFFILLVKLIHNDQGMLVLLRRSWVAIWFVLSFFAILACISFTLGLVSFSPFSFSGYLYQYNSLLGLVLPKHIAGTLILPRYSGWFIEPGFLGFFFGANVFIADNLFIDGNKLRWFKRTNIIAGFLTFSTTFFVVFVSCYLYQMVYQKKLVSKAIIRLLFFLFLPLMIYLVIYIFKTPDFIPYTSLGDRIWRFEETCKVVINMNIKHIIFGFGIIPIQTAIGGGSCSGLIDILLGRGLLLFVFVILLIFRYTRHNPALFLFIIFYSLAFGFLWYPLFLFAVILGYESYLYNNHQFSHSFNRQKRVNKRLFKEMSYKNNLHKKVDGTRQE